MAGKKLLLLVVVHKFIISFKQSYGLWIDMRFLPISPALENRQLPIKFQRGKINIRQRLCVCVRSCSQEYLEAKLSLSLRILKQRIFAV